MLCSPQFHSSKTCCKCPLCKHYSCDQATDLVALRLDDGTRKGRTYKAVFFSVSWTDETLYVPKQYVTVISEGSLSEFFDHTLNPPSPSGPQAVLVVPVGQQMTMTRSKLMNLSSTQQEAVPRIFCWSETEDLKLTVTMN